MSQTTPETEQTIDKDVSVLLATTSDGAELAVFRYETPTSERSLAPLLLLHGNGGSHGSFRNVVDELAQRRVCIVPDMRAQGVSSRGSSPLTYELLASDAICVLDAADIDKAIVLGHSDGGIEALLMARDYPERVAGFCAMGANLSPEGLLEDNPGAMEADEALYLEIADELPGAREQADLLRLMIDEPNIDPATLAAIACPATIMCGEFDCIAPAESERIANAVPTGHLVCVPEAGHGLMRDAPEAVVHEMDTLLAKVGC